MKVDQPFTAKVGDRINLPDGSSFTVSHDVNDSRCPKGVHCSWPGELRVTLLVRDGDEAPQKEAQLAHPPHTKTQTAKVGRFRVELNDVAPAPRDADTALKAGDYTFTFVVS